MSELKLSDKEYKDLIIEISIKISPVLVTKKPDSFSRREHCNLCKGHCGCSKECFSWGFIKY